MKNIRMLTNKELLEYRVDLSLELDDAMEELYVHEEYRPTADNHEAFNGTIEDWKEERKVYKQRALELSSGLAQSERELHRRDSIRTTRQQVTASAPPSQRANVVMLEDAFWDKVANKERRATHGR